MIEMISYNEEINQNQTPSFLREYQNSSNPSTLSQNEFSNHYHYLCKNCITVPIIDFSSKGKIKFSCKCNESPRELNIKNVYDFLYYSEETGNKNELLKCYHDDDFEKYIYYCKKCEKNLCIKCSNDCIKHKGEVIIFSFDLEILNKFEYIKEKINEINNIETNIIIE